VKDLVINTMTISDLNTIQSNLQTDFDDFWTYSILKSELYNENSEVIVAKYDNTIVGFASIWKSIDDAHITNIVTHKQYRNIGIGSKLLEKLINMAKDYKVKSLTLEVNEENIQAQSLYKKYQFKVLGKRKNYYKDKAAIIMTLFFNE